LQKKIQRPVALQPPQQNDRLFLQQGKFTIHGGKINAENISIKIESIESIAGDSLLKITIPLVAKKSIEKELLFCGINEATLYPELEYQAKYLKEKWTFRL
jgi:hypothetical protein